MSAPKKLEDMTDAELESHLVDVLRRSAVLNSRGFTQGSFHTKVDEGYDETKRRGKLEIYDRAYARTEKSFGF